MAAYELPSQIQLWLANSQAKWKLSSFDTTDISQKRILHRISNFVNYNLTFQQCFSQRQRRKSKMEQT